LGSSAYHRLKGSIVTNAEWNALFLVGTVTFSIVCLVWTLWRGYITDGLGDEFWRADDRAGYWIRFAIMAAIFAALVIAELVRFRFF
jgi:hypothetical protein